MTNTTIGLVIACVLLLVIISTIIYRMQVNGYKNIKTKLDKYANDEDKVMYDEYAALLKMERASSICFAVGLPLLGVFLLSRIFFM